MLVRCRVLLLAALAAMVECTPHSLPSLLKDTDIPGGDFERRRGLADAKACEQACNAEKKCRAWTFDDWSENDGCWLKSAVGKQVKKVGDVSGCSFNGKRVSCDVNTNHWLVDTDIPGGDYDRRRGLADAKACEQACNAETHCRAWTFDDWSENDGCWLKSAVGKQVKKVGDVSGCSFNGKTVSCDLYKYWLVDTDIPGGDYDRRRGLADAKACEQACNAETHCRAWTFDDWSENDGCWLKSEVGKQVKKVGDVSGCSFNGKTVSCDVNE